jgi:hypothetical protein
MPRAARAALPSSMVNVPSEIGRVVIAPAMVDVP